MADNHSRWQHVYNDLRDLIDEGELVPGQRIPAEMELTKRYGYSRNTVRTALSKLEQEGLITAGAGSLGRTVRQWELITFNVSKFELGSYADDPVNRIDQWEADAQAEGWDTRQVVASVAELPAPADVAEFLGIKQGTRVVRRRRLRYVSKETTPSVLAMIADTWTPLDIARKKVDGIAPLLSEKNVVYPGGIYRALGFRQVKYIDDIRVRMPTPQEANLLRLSTGTPVGQHARVGVDASGRRVRVLISVWAGDRQRIRYELDVPEFGSESVRPTARSAAEASTSEGAAE